MCRSGILLLTLGILLCWGCGRDGSSPPHRALSSSLQEPAYHAWAVHDQDGVLVDSGMDHMPLESPRGLNRLRQPLSASRASLHPALEEALEQAPADEVISVILSVHSAHRLSFLPRYDRTQDPDSATNLQIYQQRLLVQQADDELRSRERLPVIAAVESLGGEVTEEFRAGNALAATLEMDALRRLLEEREDIIAAAPVDSGEAPAAYYIDDGRDRQNSDQLESAGYDGDGYRVGLMDTGVYASHTVFTSPDPINYWRDCVWTVYSDCTYYPVYPYSAYYDPDDPVTSGGHGTGMADILVGNSDLGDSYRGVAPDALVDSTNVYSGVLHNSLSQTGVLRAFNLLDGVDDVIVANIAADQDYDGTISLAADDVYDEGVAVIAPVGNKPGYYSQSPANAHKVMGIGAYYASSGNDYTGQSYGNEDSRYKPDVTAPTWIRVASNSGTTSTIYRSGTCPAAAFAGGAAVLLRDYFDYRGWSSDPGLVYTGLITFGDEGGFDLDNNDGAGNLEIGEVSNSTWQSGVRYLNYGEYSDIYFYAGSNRCDLRAGIWWAEDYDDTHAKLYLYLYDPNSNLKAYSTHTNSVFQKVLYPSGMTTGYWKLRIYSSSTSPNRDQKVHYLIHYRTSC